MPITQPAQSRRGVRGRRPLVLRPLGALAALSLGGVLAPISSLQAAPQPAEEAEQAIRARYLCRGRFDAVDLTALFFNRPPAEVVLLVGEGATRLPQQPAASGARYAGGASEFWIRGERATWRLGPSAAATMACETTGAQSQR